MNGFKFVERDTFVYRVLYDVLLDGRRIGHVYCVQTGRWVDGEWFWRHLDGIGTNQGVKTRRAATEALERHDDSNRHPIKAVNRA